MKINVVDAGCGIGKTTSMINKINNDESDQRYIFITPLLSEVTRIKNSCPDKHFCAPEYDDNKCKLKEAIQILKNGDNLVTTHALFKHFNDEILKIIKEYEYTLIIDEALNTLEEVRITKSDLNILTAECISVDRKTGLVKWENDFYDGKFNEYKKLIQMNSIYAYLDADYKIVSLLWLMPPNHFEAFKEVYILTYMFDGQIQKKYFEFFNITYQNWYVYDNNLTPTKQIYDYSEVKSKIHICKKDKLNDIGHKNSALSLSWLDSHKKSDELKELQNHIRQFFRTSTDDPNKILWTTFKEHKLRVQKKGFIKGFVFINTRATNEFSDRDCVAYIANRYLKPTIKNFFMEHNVIIDKDFEDKYALSELIQFIFRSSIRNNQDITLYIPSKRMRDLLSNWIKKPND